MKYIISKKKPQKISSQKQTNKQPNKRNPSLHSPTHTKLTIITQHGSYFCTRIEDVACGATTTTNHKIIIKKTTKEEIKNPAGRGEGRGRNEMRTTAVFCHSAPL